jgi:3-dehydroquinate synthase
MRKIECSILHEKISHIPIIIGRGLGNELVSDLFNRVKAHRYVIITDKRVRELYGEGLREFLIDKGLEVDILHFPDGEGSKNLNTISLLSSELLKLGLDRRGCLISMGGGVVGDLVGFLASIYMRSIPYIQVPTTLLAQVDSSIGGKTGVDLPEGKNILGSFHQPAGIYIDLSFLSSLDNRQIINGLAEVIKYGCIQDEGLLKIIEEESQAILELRAGIIDWVVERSCEIKSSIVKNDEREMNLRRILNFGHTLGHAIEAASGFHILHGEAVSAGIVGASKISRRLKLLDEREEERIIKALCSIGLPVRIPSGCSTREIIGFLNADKKREQRSNFWILLEGIGNPVIRGDVPISLVEEIIEEMKDGKGENRYFER